MWLSSQASPSDASYSDDDVLGLGVNRQGGGDNDDVAQQQGQSGQRHRLETGGWYNDNIVQWLMEYLNNNNDNSNNNDNGNNNDDNGNDKRRRIK